MDHNSSTAEVENPLEALVLQIQAQEAHIFTPLHTRLVYLALKTKDSSIAIPILDHDIYKFPSQHGDQNGPTLFPSAGLAVPTPSSPLNYQDILLYYLHGGMIYLSVRNYDRAILFFELAMMFVANNTASILQVEAYKKWVLVNLLHKGKVPSLDKTITGQHARILRAMAKPYEAVASDFAPKGSTKDDVKRLYETIEAGKEIWEQDQNVGLISLVLRAQQRSTIISLSQIYASISIKQIHSLAFPDSTTHKQVYDYISTLISSGQLSAKLTPVHSGSDHGSAFLRFVASSPEGPEVENERVLQAKKQQARINLLNDYVKDMNHTLQLTKPYLDAWSKSKRKGDRGPGDGNTTGLHGKSTANEDEEVFEEL